MGMKGLSTDITYDPCFRWTVPLSLLQKSLTFISMQPTVSVTL
jgi:hypothetical protein